MNTLLDSSLKSSSSSNEFRIKLNRMIREANHSLKNIGRARIALIALAALSIFSYAVLTLSSSFEATNTPDMQRYIIIEGIVLILIYISCAVAAFRYPKITFIVALTVYVLMIVLTATVDVASAIRGWLLKLVMIGFLVQGIIATFQHSSALKKLLSMGLDEDTIAVGRQLKKMDTLDIKKLAE